MSTVADLQSQITQLKSDLADAAKRAADKDATIATLKAQLSAQPAAVATQADLDGLGASLTDADAAAKAIAPANPQ